MQNELNVNIIPFGFKYRINLLIREWTICLEIGFIFRKLQSIYLSPWSQTRSFDYDKAKEKIVYEKCMAPIRDPISLTKCKLYLPQITNEFCWISLDSKGKLKVFAVNANQKLIKYSVQCGLFDRNALT